MGVFRASHACISNTTTSVFFSFVVMFDATTRNHVQGVQGLHVSVSGHQSSELLRSDVDFGI